MGNRKIKESLGKTKFSTTLKNICGDKVIATADTIADLNYNTTLDDGTVTEGTYQSEINKLHADAIEELKKSKGNVSFNPKDIAYDEAMNVFELADNIDTSDYSTIILRGVLDDEGNETDVLDCTPITVENCTYVVKRTFTLNQDLVLPKNSCLCFEGGRIKANEEHWITGVFELYTTAVLNSMYHSTFTIQNNNGFSIIDEKVLLDVPHNNRFNRSWFESDYAFFNNAEAVIQLQRENIILGVDLYLDNHAYLYDLSSYRTFNFNPSQDRAVTLPLIIRISSPTLYYTLLKLSFLGSSYEEDSDTFNSIALILNNIYLFNSCETETLIIGAIIQESNFEGKNRIHDLYGLNSTINLTGNSILPNHYMYLYGRNLNFRTKYNTIIRNVLSNSTIKAPLIALEYDLFTDNICEGDFIPTRCVIKNCVFNTLDTDKYYSDEAEAKGIYFHNCTLNNTPLDSYNRFKVIE